MPKGQQPKIWGAVCNISIQVDAVSNVLSRSAYSDGVILVKLKKKFNPTKDNLIPKKITP